MSMRSTENSNLRELADRIFDRYIASGEMSCLAETRPTENSDTFYQPPRRARMTLADMESTKVATLEECITSLREHWTACGHEVACVALDDLEVFAREAIEQVRAVGASDDLSPFMYAMF